MEMSDKGDDIITQRIGKARARGELDFQNLDQLTAIIWSAPKSRREAVTEEIIRAGIRLKKYKEKFADAALAYARGEISYDKPVDLRSPSEKCLDTLLKKLKRAERLACAVNDFEDPTMKKKAVEVMDDIGQHLVKLATRMRMKEGYWPLRNAEVVDVVWKTNWGMGMNLGERR